MNQEASWEPIFSKWRHGGWYVHNVRYIGGACGCVSNNYPDKKWRIVCDPRRKDLNEEGDFTFKTRDEAARAELALVGEAKSKELSKWKDSETALTQAIGDFSVEIFFDWQDDYAVRVMRTGKEIKVLPTTTGCFEQALGWAMEEALVLQPMVHEYSHGFMH